MSRTNLDLIKECDKLEHILGLGINKFTDNDSFPWAGYGDEKAETWIEDLWCFLVADSTASLGYIPLWVVKQMPWSDDWEIRETSKKVILNPRSKDLASKLEARNLALKSQLEIAREQRVFEILEGWRNELYPVHGPGRNIELSMERAASALFGIVTYGVHMTAYVRAEEGLKIWVPRRAKTKQTYPGMRDNTVAGGISTGEEPLECLIREAEEEASLPADYVRSHAKACGTVSYFYIRDNRAGGESGLCQPECQYVYDLELPDSIIPKPDDNEAEDFRLLSVSQVKESMAAGQFKPNCALVLLDFFVRHGILVPETEKDYIEIVARLHRRLPFPMA